MDHDFHSLPGTPTLRPSRVGLAILGVIGVILFLAAGPFRTVPAGNVGVKDFFGSVSSSTLTPGISLVWPLTSVVKMSVQTQEIKEVAEVPSQEGLILSLETSLLFQLDPAKAVEIYRRTREDRRGDLLALQENCGRPRHHRPAGAVAEDRPPGRCRERDSGEAAARAGGRADEVRAPEGAAGSRAQTD